ncbi:TetR/AcrR family transcriptional regulator [Coraliomargarita parva]|uniref:TetR/AcrR family transcriptional regulator n=1 Tax=Coraliomargarita parva TaxID=3014050 RepID=UPI0022B5367C|nr:TetR/AcrR family transcriptional regulator [Coraliomargarita parva]
MAVHPPREIILAKAGELFHKRGYGAVTIDDVIQSSGLPKAAFHQNFSTKTALGKAWLERLIRRMDVFHSDFLSRAGERDKRLRKYFLSMRSWVETNGFRSCQFANTAACIDAEADEELAYLIDQYKRAQLQFFIDLVKTIVDESQARRIGTAVFLLYSGAMTECQNLKATWPLEDALVVAEKLCQVEAA